MQLKKLTVAVWAASGLVCAQAQTQLDTVTVSASPIHEHEAFEVPSQVDAISGQQKRQQESGSLGKMVESVPGVNNMGTGSQAGKPVIRGMSGNRIKVLSNGESTDFQAYGVRHIPNTEPYLSERVEVIRGPQGVLYGADAMGGVVNVIQPRIPYGEKTQGELATEYHSNNGETLVGGKVGAGSDKFGVTAGFAVREADNFRVPDVSSQQTPSPEPGDKPVFVGEVPYTNFENRSAHIGLGYDDDWGRIELRHTQWISKQNYLGMEVEGGEFVAAPTGQKLQNDETQLKTEFYLDGDWVLKPSWTHTRNRREAAHDLPYETMAEDEGTEHYLNLEVQRNDVKLALAHPRFGDFEGEVGIEMTEKEQTLHSGHLAPSADVSKRAVYLFEEADYDRWLVQFGARYDTHNVKAPLSAENEHFYDEMGVFDASNNERDFDVFSGSLGATYRLDNHWSLAGNLARGFRAPTIFELYAGGEHGGVQAFQIGNPDLEAETSLNTDLSLRWQADQARMTATVYQNWVNDYIYLANELNSDGTVKTTRNEADTADLPVMKAQQTDAVILGLELSYSQQFTPKWSGDAALEIIEGHDESNHRDLPLIPANNLTLNGHYHPADQGRWQNQVVTLGVKLAGEKNAAGQYEPFAQFDDKPVGTASTDAYAVWNLAYATDVQFDRQTLKLGAAVENLFDTDYVDFLNTYKGYTLNQGRNFKLTARVDF